MVIARVDLPSAEDEYRSKSERDWAIFGDMVLEDELGEKTYRRLYEPVSFYLEGGRYKPDFMHILLDGRVVFVEIKGSRRARGYKEGRIKFNAVTDKHPWFVWVMAVGSGDRWEVEIK